MTALLLLWIAATLAVLFAGAGLLVWTAVSASLLGLAAWAGWIGPWMVTAAALVFAPVALLLNVKPWRRRWLSRPLLDVYRTMLPGLSPTEQIALDAGTVGFEGELFTGRPNWRQLIAQPAPELRDDEKAFLEGPVAELCALIDAFDLSHRKIDLPPEIWAHLKKHRFFGLVIPREYGGHGFSAYGHRAVLQMLAGLSAEVSSAVSVPNSLGPAELLLHYGTDEQKQYYLPRLAAGEEIPCFALTGPSAGSDATSIPDYGLVCKGTWKGEETLGVRLNFDKRYITLAPVATLIGVAFKLYDPEHLIGERDEIGITLALVPRQTAGLEIGRYHLPLNVPFYNGPVRGHDVFVPLAQLIGGAAMAGHGWRMLIESLSVGRAITLPSTSTGTAKLMALATGAYARIRKQFNMPIGRFEGVEEALARIAGLTYAAEALSRMTAAAVDRGEKPAVPSAIAKYHTTEMVRQVIADAMDIHGGKGIILGPRNYLGRAWQGAPIWITVEGANILTRSMMIFGQGAIRCHPYVLKEMEAARLADQRAGLKRFDDLIFRHFGMSAGNTVRSLVLGFIPARFAPVPGDRRLGKYYRKLTRYSAAFALLADIAMLTFGGKLKQRESISARLGDALSQLYIASAMLKRFTDQGRPVADQALLSWAFNHSIYRLQEALGGVIDNYPIKAMRPLLGLVVFPLGRRARLPNDRLTHRVAQILIAPCESRTRLTCGVDKRDRAGHPIGRMEALLPRVIAAEPLERKLLKAERQDELGGYTYDEKLAAAVKRGVLNTEEASELRALHEAVFEVISVDDFALDEIRGGLAAEAETAAPHRDAA